MFVGTDSGWFKGTLGLIILHSTFQQNYLIYQLSPIPPFNSSCLSFFFFFFFFPQFRSVFCIIVKIHVTPLMTAWILKHSVLHSVRRYINNNKDAAFVSIREHQERIQRKFSQRLCEIRWKHTLFVRTFLDTH